MPRSPGSVDQDVLRLALLGDSIAYGIGAARPADALAPRLAAALADAAVTVETRVVAVPGARSADLAGQVARLRSWAPDLAVVVVGANDLTRLLPPDVAAGQLRDAVRALRALGTDVVVAPAPDLSVVPHVPAALRELVRAGSLRLRALQAEAVLGEGGRVADAEGATSRAFAADPALFSRDRFHPSSAGYAVIARALVPPLLAAVEDRGTARAS